MAAELALSWLRRPGVDVRMRYTVCDVRVDARIGAVDINLVV